MDVTDHEMLERAAEAAGYDVRWEIDDDGDYAPRYVFRLYRNGCRDEVWNPLRDEAQAMHLLVTLCMTVTATEYGACARVNDQNFLIVGQDEEPGVHGAVRRAIVKAAAMSTGKSF